MADQPTTTHPDPPNEPTHDGPGTGGSGDDPAADARDLGQPPPDVGGQVMTYTVRELAISDRAVLDGILDHFRPGWDREPGASGSLAFVADSSTFVFGAFLGQEVAGYAWGYRLRHPTGHKSLLLYNMEVDVPHRRQGLGGLMLQAALNLGRREGCATLWLVTEADNEAALELYRGLGGHAASWPVGDVVFEWSLAQRRPAVRHPDQPAGPET